MGDNKRRRKQIKGLERRIHIHERWIEEALREPYPDRRGIAKWEDDIARLRREITKLRKKLPGGEA